MQLNAKGFTMMELIMVVVVIGMISLFAVPRYNRTVSKAFARTGGDNLMIIYAGQKLKGSGNYVACANTAAINTNLNLSILENGFTYSCVSGVPTAFTCEAARTDGTFTLRVTQASASVCCAAGTCPAPFVGC